MRNIARACAIMYIIALIGINQYIEGALGSFIRVFGVITVGAWSLSLMETKRMRRFTITHVFMLLYLGLNIVTLFWTDYPDATYEASYRVALMFGAMVVLYDLFAENAKTAALCSQAGILGCTLIVGGTILNWRRGNVFMDEARYTALGMHPNGAAFVVMVGIPLAWGLLSRRETPWKPLIVLNAIYPFAALFALILTGSRGGVLESVPIIIWATYLLFRSRGGILVIATIVAAAMLVMATSAEVQANIARVTDFQKLKEDKGSGREELWPVAIKMFEDHPFTGIGAGAFRYAAGSKATINGFILGAHNAWLETAAEQGIPGILGIGLTVFSVGWFAWKAGKGRRTAMVVMFIPFPIIMCYEHLERYQYFWAILIVLFVQAHTSARLYQNEQNAEEMEHRRKRAAIREQERVPQLV